MILGKNCIYQDIIGSGHSKHLSTKNDPLLSWNFSNLATWRGDIGQKLQWGVGTQNVHLKKRPHFVLQFFKSNYLERKWGQKLHFNITIFDPI